MAPDIGGVDRARLFRVWRRVASLSWPVMVEQVSRTLMRTTDVLVTALFSPLAVAAVGLADLYARLPLASVSASGPVRLHSPARIPGVRRPGTATRQ